MSDALPTRNGYIDTPDARAFMEREELRGSVRAELETHRAIFPTGEATVPNAQGDHIPATFDPRRRTRVAPEVRGMMNDGGWMTVSIRGGNEDGGVTSHRGVLHPDEYVDHEALVRAVEAQLGFTFDDIHSVYSTGGRIPNDLRQLRDRIDGRLLALSVDGANMSELRKIIGITDMALTSALRRARGEA